MASDGWMDKKVVCPYNGILFSLKKEVASDTCYDTDELKGHYAKWNKPDTKGHMLSFDSIYMRCLEYWHSYRKNVAWWVPGTGGGGMGS